MGDQIVGFVEYPKEKSEVIREMRIQGSAFSTDGQDTNIDPVIGLWYFDKAGLLNFKLC